MIVQAGEPAGPLTLESATALLDARETEHPEDQAPEGADAGGEDGEPGLEEPTTEETPGDGAEAPEGGEGDEGAEAQPELQPLEPPAHLDAEDKAWFAELNPEAQEKFLKQETKREAVLQKAKTSAAEATERANAQYAGVEALAQHLGAELPIALQRLRTKYAGVDWERAAREMDPRAYQAAHAEFIADSRAFQTAQNAHQRAQAEAERLGVERERVALTEQAPDLAKPEKLTEIAAFLKKFGAPDDRIRKMTALEVKVAALAMDQVKALAELAKRPPKPAAPKAGTKPIAARPGPAPSPQRAATAVNNRFAQTRSIDDAVAVLNAR